MNDHTPGTSGALTDRDIVDLTKRPSDAFNEVILQADYTTRAALSFYRFRQLGGDYHLPSKRKRIKETPSADGTEDTQKYHHRKLKLGESTGRGVHYISSHPKVPMLQMSIIALMIIFESAANAYFFAKQSEFGLAGGIFQAAAVSLANVATSFFIVGYWGMRHISMPIDLENLFSRRNLYVLMGLIAIIVGLSLVFLVNCQPRIIATFWICRLWDKSFQPICRPKCCRTSLSIPRFAKNPEFAARRDDWQRRDQCHVPTVCAAFPGCNGIVRARPRDCRLRRF